jgi:hypothetical protein
MLLSRAQEEAHECRPLLASAAYDMSGLLTRAITAPQLFNVASPLLCALLAHAPPDDTSCWELFSSQRVLVTLLSGARLESPAAVQGVLRLASFMVSRPVAGELLVRDYVLPALCTVPHLRKPPAVGTPGRALWHTVWCSVVSLASAMMRHLHGISAFAAQITEFVTVFQDRILSCLTIDGARALDLSLPRVEEAERCTDLLCQLERHGAIWRFRQPAFAQVREGALVLLRCGPAAERGCAELPAAAAAARPLLLEPAVLQGPHAARGQAGRRRARCTTAGVAAAAGHAARRCARQPRHGAARHSAPRQRDSRGAPRAAALRGRAEEGAFMRLRANFLPYSCAHRPRSPLPPHRRPTTTPTRTPHLSGSWRARRSAASPSCRWRSRSRPRPRP